MLLSSKGVFRSGNLSGFEFFLGSSHGHQLLINWGIWASSYFLMDLIWPRKLANLNLCYRQSSSGSYIRPIKIRAGQVCFSYSWVFFPLFIGGPSGSSRDDFSTPSLARLCLVIFFQVLNYKLLANYD